MDSPNSQSENELPRPPPSVPPRPGFPTRLNIQESTPHESTPQDDTLQEDTTQESTSQESTSQESTSQESHILEIMNAQNKLNVEPSTTLSSSSSEVGLEDIDLGTTPRIATHEDTTQESTTQETPSAQNALNAEIFTTLSPRQSETGPVDVGLRTSSESTSTHHSEDLFNFDLENEGEHIHHPQPTRSFSRHEPLENHPIAQDQVEPRPATPFPQASSDHSDSSLESSSSSHSTQSQQIELLKSKLTQRTHELEAKDEDTAELINELMRSKSECKELTRATMYQKTLIDHYREVINRLEIDLAGLQGIINRGFDTNSEMSMKREVGLLTKLIKVYDQLKAELVLKTLRLELRKLERSQRVAQKLPKYEEDVVESDEEQNLATRAFNLAAKAIVNEEEIEKQEEEIWRLERELSLGEE